MGVQEHVQGKVPGEAVYLEIGGVLRLQVELCAPVHCMLAEAVALAPGSTIILQTTMVLMQTLQDAYFAVGARICQWSCLTL